MKIFLVKWEGNGSYVVQAESEDDAVEKFMESSDDWDGDDEDDLEAVEVEMEGGVSVSSVEDLRSGG